MTNHGYMLFTFRVHPHGDPNNPLSLGDLGGRSGSSAAATDSTDALVVLYGLLHGLKGRRIDERDRHLQVAEVCPEGRCVRFTIDLGMSGQSSVFLDPERRSTSPVFRRVNRHIETNPRRGLLVVPTNSAVGLLVLEARSRSTGKDQLTAVLKRGFRKHTGLIIDFDAVVHEAALTAFLAQAQINALTLKRHSLTHDIAEQLEVRQPDEHLGCLELRIGRGRIGAFRQHLIDKFRQDKEARSRLLSMGGLNFDELNVKMQVGDRNTTLSVSADRAPSFVYHLSSASSPTDQHFYDEVFKMVPEVAGAFAMIVGAAWKTGTWSEERLAVKLDTPLQEGPGEDGQGETQQ